MASLLDEMTKCLEIREVKSVLPHEQIVSYNVKRLKEAMLNIGHIVDPLIVDKKTGVVLDGHHRLKVLEIIECQNAVVQTVDYMSNEITVGTWYPSIEMKLDKLLKLDSVKFEKVELQTGKKAVDSLKAPFLIQAKGQDCYLVNPGNYKLKEMIEEQNYLFSLLDKSLIDYVAGQEIDNQLEGGRSVFYRRAYTKEDIVKTAQAHSPLPPKSTRHLIPGRIIRLNMKLGWLNNSKEEALAHLHELLKTRVYAGNARKYYEPVIVIY